MLVYGDELAPADVMILSCEGADECTAAATTHDAERGHRFLILRTRIDSFGVVSAIVEDDDGEQQSFKSGRHAPRRIVRRPS